MPSSGIWKIRRVDIEFYLSRIDRLKSISQLLVIDFIIGSFPLKIIHYGLEVTPLARNRSRIYLSDEHCPENQMESSQMDYRSLHLRFTWKDVKTSTVCIVGCLYMLYAYIHMYMCVCMYISGPLWVLSWVRMVTWNSLEPVAWFYYTSILTRHTWWGGLLETPHG